MLRGIMSFFGSIFSLITLVILMIALSIGAIFVVYGKDLPSHESLANTRRLRSAGSTPPKAASSMSLPRSADFSHLRKKSPR